MQGGRPLVSQFKIVRPPVPTGIAVLSGHSPCVLVWRLRAVWMGAGMQPPMSVAPGTLQRHEDVTAQAALSSGGVQTVLPGRARWPWAGRGGGRREAQASCSLLCLLTWSSPSAPPGSWQYHAPPHPQPKPPEDRDRGRRPSQ